MGKKFNRNYRLTIQSNPSKLGSHNPNFINAATNRLYPAVTTTKADNLIIQSPAQTAIEIKPPFTIEINIDSTISSGASNATIKIFGLNPTTRQQLWKDSQSTPFISDDVTSFRQVVLEAGYGKEIKTIFAGNLIEGYSQREGVDEVTYLKCISGAFGLYNTFINLSYVGDTNYNKIINDVIDELCKVGYIEKGAITAIDGTTNGSTQTGESFRILSQFGCHVFIYLNKINMLKLDEVIAAIGAQDLLLINADNGLIGTPIRSGGNIEFQMMFEPRIPLGGLIQLESKTTDNFNGIFKVVGVKHSGIISPAKDGKLITTVQLWAGYYLYNLFKKVYSST